MSMVNYSLDNFMFTINETNIKYLNIEKHKLFKCI